VLCAFFLGIIILLEILNFTTNYFKREEFMKELVEELEKSIKYMSANKETMFNRFKGFKDFEISKIQRLIDWVKTPAGFDSNTSKKNFYLYFKEQDKRRGTDFVSVFPQLTNFWNECKDLNGS
jgi:predicted PP-loop superfamily ATPase